MYGRGIKLFRLFGFEVRVDWSWGIIAILIVWSLARGLFPYYFKGLSSSEYWWMAVAGAAGLFMSIVMHELGHSLVARAYGIPMKGITLFVFGGVAQMGEEPPNPLSEFLMAMAGPLTSVLLGAFLMGIDGLGALIRWPVSVAGVLGYLAWINLALAAFNMIPAFPLDGGRVLRSILWAWKKSFAWSTRIASRIGTAFGYVLVVLGLVSIVLGDFISGIWWVLLGMFLHGASRASYRQVQVPPEIHFAERGM